MSEQCFYCQDEIGENKRYALFIKENDALEVPLCPECYQEWLEGIKE
ncbi:hypothetical protein SAMN05421736_109109 [Evansella caseinilytica]|uniref:Small CPxCG-related zinc finger protein n=1 Tax=Evansella caseinilytica TaxID=1503961 RepID=A0A1H3RXF3_9BACI|nr:hypothetical protein [Evansella caseinilytica]SDZ30290.1 hypothetical protein SAMN05421736_109109 [Evansella caseinilytica]